MKSLMKNSCTFNFEDAASSARPIAQTSAHPKKFVYSNEITTNVTIHVGYFCTIQKKS